MNKISIELPVKLNELFEFSFNFNNLIKTISYLHQNELSLHQNLKDIDMRLSSMESLRNDIEELKIKSSNIEKSNDNLNRSFLNLQDKILKYDKNITDVQLKTNDIESQLKKFENIQIEQEQNLIHLNKVVEDNSKASNRINDVINLNNKNLIKITEKYEEIEKKDKEKFENVSKNIKEINSFYEVEHKKIENINNSIVEINETVKNIMNNFEKKNSDMNNRILDIINDIAEINNNFLDNNINISSNISQKNYKYRKEIKEITPSISNTINKESTTSNNLFKIAIDEIEEGKKKFNKLKEDFEIYKDNIKKGNDSVNKNINNIKEEYFILKSTIEENVESINNLENNFNLLNDYVNSQKEEKEQIEEKDKQNKDENNDIDIAELSNKYVKLEAFKKISDNVRILTSTINTKAGREEMETQLKKLNQRLENVEMIQQGQTHGPKTRINLGLVNIPFSSIDSSNQSNNSEEPGELNEFDYLVKKIEKKINGNLLNIINKEMKSIDFSLNPKVNELFNKYKKLNEEIDKNNKDISDIKNILAQSPKQKDLIKFNKNIEQLEEEIKANKIKIIDLTKYIEGTDEDEDDEALNNLPGSIKSKINILNRTCQTLNSKIISLENKQKSVTKEVKDDIKQHLKNETAKIMQQFKLRLESFTNKFEHELKNKIDQIGLSDFETKINNKFNIDLKEKLDKNDMKKNNNIIKRKIDNLENKISKTLVDTIIDLQMDDQPLIIKKNGNGVDVCASCNQQLSRNSNNFIGGEFASGNISSMSNLNMSRKNIKNLVTYTLPSNIKSNNQNSDRSLKNINSGNNKLPDIIPPIHPK